MDYNLSSELKEHLGSGEKLIWTGRPKQGVIFRISDIYLIPFSLLWLGGAAIATYKVILFVPFLIMGLIAAVGRFFIDSYLRSNTHYALTNERIIIKSGIFDIGIKSINLKTIPEMEVKEKYDRSGTIIIGPKDSRYAAGWFMGSNSTTSLDMIQDAKLVYNKIVEIQKTF
jgi:hypothetical protein